MLKGMNFFPDSIFPIYKIIHEHCEHLGGNCDFLFLDADRLLPASGPLHNCPLPGMLFSLLFLWLDPSLLSDLAVITSEGCSLMLSPKETPVNHLPNYPIKKCPETINIWIFSYLFAYFLSVLKAAGTWSVCFDITASAPGIVPGTQ